MFALLFFYLFLLQTSSVQIRFCNHYSCPRTFYSHAKLLSDQIRQFQGKNAFLGEQRAGNWAHSTSCNDCPAWLTQHLAGKHQKWVWFFGESFTDSLFLQESEKSCWEKLQSPKVNKENVMIFCKKKKKKKRDLFSDQIFCCCCCTFGGEKALFSHQPNFQGVSKKSSGLAVPLAFPLLSPYADLTFQSITEQGCQILPLEFLLNTPANNHTALSISQQIIKK